MAWHNLTEIKEFIDLRKSFLSEWEIIEVPLFTPNGTEFEETDFKMLIGSDDKLPIGKPFAESYSPISNKMFIEMIADAVAGIDGAVVKSVGSVCNRGRVFVSVSIKDAEEYAAGDRKFKSFLNFGNGHDQTSSFWVNNTDICTVCDNTFTMNLFNGKTEISARVLHRGNVEVKLENVSDIIDGHLGAQVKFKREFEKLMAEPMKVDEAQKLFAGWTMRNAQVPIMSTQAINKVTRLTDLFSNGAGNSGKNRADAFSAVTDYYTHESTRGRGNNLGNQFVASEFGTGRAAKENFWEVIRDDGLIAQYNVLGEYALAHS